MVKVQIGSVSLRGNKPGLAPAVFKKKCRLFNVGEVSLVELHRLVRGIFKGLCFYDSRLAQPQNALDAAQVF